MSPFGTPYVHLSAGLLTYEDLSSPFASLNNVATPMRLRRSGLAPAPLTGEDKSS